MKLKDLLVEGETTNKIIDAAEAFKEALTEFNRIATHHEDETHKNDDILSDESDSDHRTLKNSFNWMISTADKMHKLILKTPALGDENSATIQGRLYTMDISVKKTGVGCLRKFVTKNKWDVYNKLVTSINAIISNYKTPHNQPVIL